MGRAYVHEYSTDEVEAHPFGIFVDSARRASVLAMPQVVRSLGICFVISLSFVGLSLFLEKSADAALTSIGSTVSAGLFFLLGPFVALKLQLPLLKAKIQMEQEQEGVA